MIEELELPESEFDTIEAVGVLYLGMSILTNKNVSGNDRLMWYKYDYLRKELSKGTYYGVDKKNQYLERAGKYLCMK